MEQIFKTLAERLVYHPRKDGFKKKLLLIDLCLFKTDTQAGIMGDYVGKGKWGTICMLMEERAKSLFFYKKKNQTRSESSLTNIFIRECSKILWHKNEQQTSHCHSACTIHLFDYDMCAF